MRNESFSNLKNVLQRKLRTNRARECIFRVFGLRKFWKFIHSAPTMVAPSWVQCVYQSAQKTSGYVTGLYSCITLCFHMSLLLCNSIVFLKLYRIFSYTLSMMTFWHNLRSLWFLSFMQSKSVCFVLRDLLFCSLCIKMYRWYTLLQHIWECFQR